MSSPDPHSAPAPSTPWRYQLVDVLTMGYAVFVFFAVALLGGHLEHQVEYLAFHLGVFLGVRLLVPFARRSRWRLARFLAETYPLALFAFFYIYSNRVNTIFFRDSFDPFFRRLDLDIFGVEPCFWLARNLGTPLLHEVVHALYSTYYVMIPAVALIYYFTRPAGDDFRRLLFTLSLTFYTSYLTFIILPVHGPNLLRGDDYAGGVLFVPLMDAIYRAAESGGGAFPSSHVAVALVCLIFCRRHSRALFAIWIVPFVGLTSATVYCRYHYAVDSLAGLAWGLAWYAIGVCVFDRLGAHRAPPFRARP